MPAPAQQPRTFGTLLVLGGLALAVVVALLEHWSQSLLARSAAEGGLDPMLRGPARLANTYLAARAHVLEHVVLYSLVALAVPAAIYAGLRRATASASRWRERLAGMTFGHESYALASPFRGGRHQSAAATAQDAFVHELAAECARTQAAGDAAAHRVLLGFDDRGGPVYLGERARSMHVHLLGQTGSGKTQSVIYPLLYQDARRGRPIVFLDAKGSMDNEDTVAAIAAATGRLGKLRIFTLNPGRPTHTFNPVHMAPDADPRQVAERVFSTMEPDLDVAYYKDMARELFLNLVAALASTGKQMTMLDLAAAIADPEILLHALTLADDKTAVQTIKSRYARLAKARKLDETYTGLLAAVRRYDHPALNVYDPDIVLEDLVEQQGIVAFSLPANAYKFAARAVGLLVLQHLQHLGALRQMDRQRSQAPLYVYADEFYSFAYEGFVDAVNKLRDAHISMLLAHQDLSDLDRVSPEFARGVWGNTRNKVVLFQSDPELCERLAQAAGTQKATKLTVRRTVDGFLNQASALEASSREVDEFVLHPNQLKALKTGQAYLVQTGVGEEDARAPARWPWRRCDEPAATRVVGVNLAMLKPLPAARPSAPKVPDDSHGLRLHDLFCQERARTSCAGSGRKRP